MKKILLSLAAVAALGVFAVPALADDGHYRNFRGWGSDRHQRYHDDLAHREFHRQLDHREAHRYPMSWWQHERLHDALDHDRFHDRLEHRNYHRYDAPYRSGRGFGIYGPGFYFRFGR